MKTLEEVSLMLSMEKGITFYYGNNVPQKSVNKPVSRQGFTFMGQVKYGQQLGRKWGVPTANLDAEAHVSTPTGHFLCSYQAKKRSVISGGRKPWPQTYG